MNGVNLFYRYSIIKYKNLFSHLFGHLFGQKKYN